VKKAGLKGKTYIAFLGKYNIYSAPPTAKTVVRKLRAKDQPIHHHSLMI